MPTFFRSCIFNLAMRRRTTLNILLEKVFPDKTVTYLQSKHKINIKTRIRTLNKNKKHWTLNVGLFLTNLFELFLLYFNK